MASKFSTHRPGGTGCPHLSPFWTVSGPLFFGRIVALQCTSARQIQRVKAVLRCTLCMVFSAGFTAIGQPAFTSLQVFGDSASSTTDSPGLPEYHGNRYSNGRMWVEVLAGWQGMHFDITNHNQSFWEHYSFVLTNTVETYTPPPDATSALFVVWVNNADMYWNITETPLIYDDSQLSKWTNANNQWISHHLTAISNLHAKGARTLLMPNAVDLTQTPDFAPGLDEAERAWIRERTREFNDSFQGMLDQAMAMFPDLTIYSPDIFTLFDAVLSSPETYGMINPGMGALDDPGLGDYSLDGPGADYVYWDYIHPTAKFQWLIAEEARKLIWPTRIRSITGGSGTTVLGTMNVPMGRPVEGDGRVEGSANLMDWIDVQFFPRTNTSLNLPVPVDGPRRFYRLSIPSQWVWP